MYAGTSNTTYVVSPLNIVSWKLKGENKNKLRFGDSSFVLQNIAS